MKNDPKRSSNVKKLLTQKRFFLASNFHTYGIQHALKDYLLRNNAKGIYFLNHPLHGVSKDKFSTLEYYESKKLVSVKRIRRRKFPEAVNYLVDLFITLQCAAKTESKIDVFIGFNSMNTLAGVLLKVTRRVKLLISYSHSYKERRYPNYLLNKAYSIVDKISVSSSDLVWGLGKPLVGIREKQGIASEKLVYAPDGVDTRVIKPLPYSSEKRTRLIFLGLINQINGLELVVDSLPHLLSFERKITLDVIGDGEDREKIVKKVKKMKLEKIVTFHGILPIDKIAKILPQFGIGIATYKPLVDSTLKTTDPMKTKLYMAAGLPIISTDLYLSSHEIKDHNLGKLINYNGQDFVEAVKALSKEKKYLSVRKNCIMFVKKYDWEIIFNNAFSKTFI